jgi:hypothetical protein
VGRPRLQYLKQVAKKHSSWQLYSNGKNGLQQLQMENCQSIKRLRDKKEIIRTVLGKTALSEGMLYFGSVILSYISHNR